MTNNRQVEAVFNGDNPLNQTGLAILRNGTRCVVCATLQYFPYKPSSSSIWLTVEPQTTHFLQTTETPEQLQQEAE